MTKNQFLELHKSGGAGLVSEAIRAGGVPASAGQRDAVRIPLAVRSKPCEHIGKALQPRSEWTDAKGNRTMQVCKTYRACSKHGLCFCHEAPAGVQSCQTCPDYSTGEDSPESIITSPTPLPPKASLRVDVRKAHIELWKKTLDGLAPYPGGRQGAGVLYCGGGKYNFGLYLSIRLLREVGCHLPVQIWHQGVDEPVDPRVRSLAGVRVVDATTHPERRKWRMLGGWQMKMIAGLNCGWEKWIFSDADNYPVSDPTYLIDLLDRHPAILWPDIEGGDDSVVWGTYGLEPDESSGINGGSSAFNASTAWRAINLAHHFDMYSDHWYNKAQNVGGYGDQDQVRVAFHATGTPYLLACDRPLCRHGVFVQNGPNGSPMWVHRIKGKPAVKTEFGPATSMRKRMDLPMESRVWEILDEYKRCQ